ncbi:unnamed protein product [Sphagnum tenellum]
MEKKAIVPGPGDLGAEETLQTQILDTLLSRVPNSVSCGDNNNLELAPPLKKCRLWSPSQQTTVSEEAVEAVVISSAVSISPIQATSSSSCACAPEAPLLQSQIIVAGCRSVDLLKGWKEQRFCQDRECSTDSEAAPLLPAVSLDGVSRPESHILQTETSEECVSLSRSERINLEDVCVEIVTSTSPGFVIEPAEGSTLQPNRGKNLEEDFCCGFPSSSSSIGLKPVRRTAEDLDPCAADEDASLLSPKKSILASQMVVAEGSCSPRTPPKRPSTDQEIPGAPVKAREERPPRNLRLQGRARRKLLFDNL